MNGGTLKERILAALRQTNGLTDAELASLFQVRHQAVNAACRTLQTKGVLLRASVNGVIRNTLCPNACCTPGSNHENNSAAPSNEGSLNNAAADQVRRDAGMPSTGARVSGGTLKERILAALRQTNGLTDAELASLFQVRHQAVNAACRTLQMKGVLRRTSVNGVIRNTLCTNTCCTPSPAPNHANNSDDPLYGKRLNYVVTNKTRKDVSQLKTGARISGETIEMHILSALRQTNGLTDAELAQRVQARLNTVSDICRTLKDVGILLRVRVNGAMCNTLRKEASCYLSGSVTANNSVNPLCEERLKEVLNGLLQSRGWTTAVAWGHSHGADILAQKGNRKLVVEVKGRGSRHAMNKNYFLSILGELLERMDDPNARYGIALPDLPQFKTLWQKLPNLAKKRNGIFAVFIDSAGHITISRH